VQTSETGKEVEQAGGKSIEGLEYQVATATAKGLADARKQYINSSTAVYLATRERNTLTQQLRAARRQERAAKELSAILAAQEYTNRILSTRELLNTEIARARSEALAKIAEIPDAELLQRANELAERRVVHEAKEALKAAEAVVAKKKLNKEVRKEEVEVATAKVATPHPKVEKSPNPKVKKIPNPKVEKSPNPKVEKSPNPKVKKSPHPKVEKSPNPKVKKRPHPKVEEASKKSTKQKE
jgi:hypothetical protein